MRASVNPRHPDRDEVKRGVNGESSIEPGSRARTLDIEEFAKNLARMVEQGGKALAAYLKPREEGRIEGEYAEFVDVVKTLGQVARILAQRPAARARAAVRARPVLSRSVGHRGASAWPAKKPQPVAAPDPRDKRFADPEWSSNQFFDFLKQAYLLTVNWADHLVKDAEGLDPHTRQKADFYVRQIVNAIAPSNFVLTNPELLRETLASNAENLVRGMHMLAEDIEAGGGDLQDPPVRPLDVRGRPQSRDHARQGDLPERPDAAHPVRADDRDGAQAPAADRAALDQQVLRARPHAGKVLHQMVRRPRASRCSVISWVNPDARLAKKNFEDYMREGPLAALDVDQEGDRREQGQRHRLLRRRHAARGHARLHGGQARHAHRVGDLLREPGRFHPCGRSQGVRRRGADRGARAPDGRARLSRQPQDGELLQPAALERPDLALRHQQLPQGQGAAAVRPAVLEFRRDPHAGGQPFLLSAQLLPREQSRRAARWRSAARRSISSKVKIPIYNLATREDHIAPAKSVLLGSKFFGGPVRFVLAGSGHIAGVVNPPGQAQVPVLDRRQADRRRRRQVARQGRGASRAPGGRTGSTGSRRT